MNQQGKDMCEFCSKKTKDLASTSFVGNYCIECHQILIEESRNAIREIRANK